MRQSLLLCCLIIIGCFCILTNATKNKSGDFDEGGSVTKKRKYDSLYDKEMPTSIPSKYKLLPFVIYPTFYNPFILDKDDEEIITNVYKIITTENHFKRLVFFKISDFYENAKKIFNEIPADANQIEKKGLMESFHKFINQGIGKRHANVPSSNEILETINHKHIRKSTIELAPQEFNHLCGPSLLESQLTTKVDKANGQDDILVTYLKPGEIFNKFSLKDDELIGWGSFGKIYGPYTKRYNDQTYEVVVKKLKKEKCGEDLHKIPIEIEAMEKIKSKFTMYLLDQFQDDHFYYLVMPYMDGVDLFKFSQILLCGIGFDSFSLVDGIRFIIASVSLAGVNMNKAGYLNLDLKANNIFLTKDGYLRVGDFGNVERLSDNANKDVSLYFWEMGAMLHYIILQQLIFDNKYYFTTESFTNVAAWEYAKYRAMWDIYKVTLCWPLAEFIAGLLEFDEEKRISSWEEMLEHPFMAPIKNDPKWKNINEDDPHIPLEVESPLKYMMKDVLEYKKKIEQLKHGQ